MHMLPGSLALFLYPLLFPKNKIGRLQIGWHSYKNPIVATTLRQSDLFHDLYPKDFSLLTVCFVLVSLSKSMQYIRVIIYKSFSDSLCFISDLIRSCMVFKNIPRFVCNENS